MDLINKAKDWKQVDEQLTHEVPGHMTSETRKIPSNGMLTLKVTITYPGRGKKRVFASIPVGVITGPYTTIPTSSERKKSKNTKYSINISVYPQIQALSSWGYHSITTVAFSKQVIALVLSYENKIFFTRQLKSFSYEVVVHKQRRSQALSSSTRTPWVQLCFDKEARWSARWNSELDHSYRCKCSLRS